MPTEETGLEPTKPRRGRWRGWLKWSLFGVVLAFVAQRGVEIWRKDGASLAQLSLDWRWIPPAMAAYIAGWLPSVWFWRRMMHRLGARLRFRDTARAYYCGHLGKYAPGKAGVFLIRAALVRELGFFAAPAAVTVAFETLSLMGSGCAVAAALAPRLLAESHRSQLPPWMGEVVARPWLPPLLVAAFVALMLPLMARLFTRVARRMTPAEMLLQEQSPKIDPPLLASGLVALSFSWMLLGLSLGCTLKAIGASTTFSDWPVWTGAVSFATAVAFIAIFAPGGMGVREGLLMEALRGQEHIAPAQAVAATILLRILWLLAEIIAAAALYYAIRPRVPKPDAATPSEVSS